MLIIINNNKPATNIHNTNRHVLHWALWSRARWWTRGRRWRRGRRSSSRPRCTSSPRLRTTPPLRRWALRWWTPAPCRSAVNRHCCCIGCPSLATPPPPRPEQGRPLVNRRWTRAESVEAGHRSRKPGRVQRVWTHSVEGNIVTASARRMKQKIWFRMRDLSTLKLLILLTQLSFRVFQLIKGLHNQLIPLNMTCPSSICRLDTVSDQQRKEAQHFPQMWSSSGPRDRNKVIHQMNENFAPFLPFSVRLWNFIKWKYVNIVFTFCSFEFPLTSIVLGCRHKNLKI